jgi:hypothetical protein
LPAVYFTQENCGGIKHIGRQFTYRHRLKSEAASVKAKTLFDYLVGQVKAQREVSYDVKAGLRWRPIPMKIVG